MTAPHASDVISGYLARLEREASDLPRRERQELLDGIREHIREAREAMPEETDAHLLTLLDRLGHPADLVDEERARLGMRPREANKPGFIEYGALILTPLIWPIGVILLWTSRAWNTRDKLIGTLLPPGGLFTSLTVVLIVGLALPAQSCTTHYGVGRTVTHCTSRVHEIDGLLLAAFLILVFFSPIVTGVYMGMRLRRWGLQRRDAVLLRSSG